ncbi:hypothetical protein AAG906_011383 [Vitis piasezkii]
MIEHLTKAIEMTSHLGFNRNRENSVRFIRISEFATSRKSTCLVIPEGEKGRGWENLKSALSRQYKGEKSIHNHVGPLYRSFANVVNYEGPRRGGLVLVGKWVRAVVCECNAISVKWVEVGRAVARSLGKKGVTTIVPISVQWRRWSPKENSEIEGKFRGGWIELRGLPFHLWSEARVRIAMKDRSVLPALIEVIDGDWVFTIFVSVMGESSWEVFASHSGTGGGRRVERVRSTAGGRCRVGEDGRMKKGGERSMADVFPVGTHEEAGGVKACGEEVSSDEDCRATERKAQSLSKSGPLFAKVGCNLKGPSGLGQRLGGKKPDDKKDEWFREERSEIWFKEAVDYPFSSKFCSPTRGSLSRGEVASCKPSFDEDREGFLGRVGSDIRGLAVMVLPSTPEIRGKGLSFMGNCGLLVAENLEVNSSSPTQSPLSSLPPSCGLASSFLSSSILNLPNDVGTVGQISVGIPNLVVEEIQSAYPNQLTESFNPIMSKPILPNKVSNLVTVSQGDTMGSPSGIFQEEEQMLHRFSRSENPDVVMIQETKKAECDRSEEMVIGSFSVSVKFALDGCRPLWLSAVYGPNNSLLRKDFWVELLDIFELSFPFWCVGGDFNVIRRSSEKLGGSSLTPSMKDFDDFIRECELLDPPLRSAPFTWSNMQESPCARDWIDFFTQMILETNPFKWGPTPFRVEGLDWSPISGESASRLDSPFTEEEISKAIFQLERDKAPGPDGFTIVEDLVRVFASFTSGIINQSTNASFIVLLPKKSMSKKISDFRPINLITSLYKIIAKVLSGRLRGVLHETIHSTQGAFVQGRQILDAILIANEIVDEKRRSGEEGVVFKIDFEKAYDHVVGRNRTIFLSHLQFADDTIFLSSTREEDLQTLKSLLLVFGHISGLKVNIDKSNIYGINLKHNHLSRLAELLDCKASGWPILYLRLPLGGNPKACGFWDPVIERILRRLDE